MALGQISQFKTQLQGHETLARLGKAGRILF
jgi:hypothetical protein